MKASFFLLFFLAIPVCLFSQPNIYQSTEIYKKNGVKTRTTSVHAKMVDHFDENGLLTETDYFTHKNVFFAKEKFEYDSAQNIVREVYYFTRSDENLPAAGKIADSIQPKIEHDLKGRVIKKTWVDTLHKTWHEKTYTYEPFTVSDKWIYGVPKKSQSEQISYFDDKHIETMVQTIFIRPGADTTENTFKYYENIYNRSGNIKKRKIKTTPTIFDSFHDYSRSYPVEHNFEYNKRGLLISFKYRLANGKEGEQSFTYEFW